MDVHSDPARQSPVHLIVMGVTGTGKSTVGEGLAEHFGLVFAEGDLFHSQANIDKMAAGHPLTDEDRWPWLRSIRDWMTDKAAEGRSTVVACSALRDSYRDVLREADGVVFFVHVVLPEEVNHSRLENRSGHYMKSDMLESQLDTLEHLDDDERGILVLNVGNPDDVVADAVRAVEDRFHIDSP